MENLDEVITEEQKNRKQKNLNLSENSREWIEQKSKEWYDSKNKQGQVIDTLIREYQRNQPIYEEIEEIKRILATEYAEATPSDFRADLSTHKGEIEKTQTSESGGDDDGINTTRAEIEEMERRADAGKPVSPSEYDVSKIKGARGVDRAAIVQAMLRADDTTDTTSKADIRDMARKHLGYGKNRARELAEEALLQMKPHYLAKMENEWLPQRIRKEKESREMRENGRIASPKAYERELGKSLEDYTGAYELPTEEYYSTDEEVARGVWRAVQTLGEQYQNPSDSYERKRVRRTLHRLLVEVEPDVAQCMIDEDTKLGDAVTDYVRDTLDIDWMVLGLLLQSAEDFDADRQD